MKAVMIYKHGGIEELIYKDTDIPICNQGEVLIEVKAISMNHFDILSRKGIYPKMKLPRIVGMDCAGEIAESKAIKKNFKKGDRVLVLGETLGLGNSGAYSEFVKVPEEEVFIIPENLSFKEAACIGISYLTAYYAIDSKLQNIHDQTVFIPGASGGVATALIQLAKLKGARVIASSRADTHCKMAENLGADYSINSNDLSFLDKILVYTNQKGVDVVINSVGGKTIPQSMDVVKKKGGRIVLIGSAAGRNVEIDIFQLLIREMYFIGCNFGSLEPEERGEIYEKVKVLFQNQSLKVILSKEFPLSEIQKATSYMEEGSHFGKIVLIP
jgi:putative YhdH/YhfP family quinone oxidoreductase